MESPNLETQTNKSGRESSHIPNDNAPACTCVCVCVCVCVCQRKKSKRFSWDRHLTFVESDNIFRMCDRKKEKWITFIFSHSNLSLCPVYQPVPVRRDAVSLFNRSISLPFPCHANKKGGCVGLGQGRGHYCLVKGTEDISVLLRGRDEQQRVHEREEGRYTSRGNHSNPLKGKTSFPVSQ